MCAYKYTGVCTHTSNSYIPYNHILVNNELYMPPKIVMELNNFYLLMIP